MGKKFVGLDGLKHFWTKAKTWITGQITAEVTAKIAEIVANAPEDLDTLKEIADWITEHANSAAEMNTQIIKNQDDIKLLQNKTVESCPVDVVENGNMHAVTSNAVANALGEWEDVWRQDSDNYILGVKNSLGTWLRIRFSGLVKGNISNGTLLLVLPQEWRPVISSPNRCVIAVDTLTDRINAGLDIETDGEIRVYFSSNTPLQGTVTVTGLFCDIFMNIQ